MQEIQSLTTGQAARYCHVSQATIINWIKKGKLEAYATPGGHYRILLPDFLAFLETYKMPVDASLRRLARPRVLVVSHDSRFAALAQTLQQNGDLDVTLVTDCTEANALMTHLRPAAIVVDLRYMEPESLALCRRLRVSTQRKPTLILAVGDPESEHTARAAGADAYLPATAIADGLAAELETLLAPAGPRSQRNDAHKEYGDAR